MKRFLFLIPILMFVASCTHIKMIEPKPQEIGKAYQVNPTKQWNGLNKTSFQTVAEQWTKDGPLLNGISFWHNISNDDALFEERGVEYPKFREDMRATEVMEFFVSSAAKTGAVDFETSNLRPAKFGDADGFRFEYTYVTDDGLKMRGMVLAAVIEKKLQMMSFWATEAHYYEQNVEEVEKIFGSVQLI